jgi:hypothetical protein
VDDAPRPGRGEARTVTRAGALVLVILLALAAAGCGGKKQPTAEDWANGVCSAVSTWTTSLKSIGSSLTSDPTMNGLKTAKNDLSSANDKFVGDLKGLQKPNTKSGQQAKQITDTLANQIDQDKQAISDAVDKASGVQGVLTAAKAIQSTMSAMGTQFEAAFTSLQTLDVSGELESAFKNADSCKKLAQSSS